MTMRILLVEDELNILEALRFIIEREGWQVETHSDGETAIDVIRSSLPDVVVLDYMLPGRSGLEILEELRSTSEFQDLPVLMLTAKGQARDRAQAEKAGVSRFMTKPFSNTEVLKAIRDLAYLRAN